MRRQRKTTTAANLLASKRIAIAFCAAVAMVLGAMSVGATMHFYPSSPTPISMPTSSDPTMGTPTTQHANITANVASGSTKADSSVPIIITDNKDLHKQSKLTPILISPPTQQRDKKDEPLLVVPNIISQTSLTLGPLSVSADPSNNSVQLNASLTPAVTVQVPTTLSNILPSGGDSSTPSGSTSSSPTDTSSGSGSASTNQTPAAPPSNNTVNSTPNNGSSVATNTTN